MTFKIELPVRIYDINYGGHLGHAELIMLMHQARLKFFAAHGLQEHNIDGAGVIVKSLQVEYQGEAFFDDVLHISIELSAISKAACIFHYLVTKNDGIAVATVTEKILFMNYQSRKVVRVPKKIFSLSI